MINKRGIKIFFIALIFLEVFVAIVLFFGILFSNISYVRAGVGQNNVTMATLLDVGNVVPDVINITMNTNYNLVPNSTVHISAIVVARDYNGEDDITNVTLVFFDNIASSLAAADDNNSHYRNTTCAIDRTYGDAYQIMANCSVYLWYYANNASWNASVAVTDNVSLTGRSSNLTTINTLLALALPDSIDYGIVNVLNVSDEVAANVTNVGNVAVNLSLSGYATYVGDNRSMNCSLGIIRNISIGYEKYNITSSIVGPLNLTEFEANYSNLTSNVAFKKFDLPKRINNTYNEAFNTTYWRIYVPLGVAGSCRGNIVFGAFQGTGS